MWWGPRPVPGSPQLQVTEFATVAPGRELPMDLAQGWASQGGSRGPRRCGKAPRPEQPPNRGEGVRVPSSTAKPLGRHPTQAAQPSYGPPRVSPSTKTGTLSVRDR